MKSLLTLTLIVAICQSIPTSQESGHDGQVTPRNKLEALWTVKLSSPSFGGAAVADVDHDGKLEVAFGTYFGDDSLRVLHGSDGREMWNYDAGTACLDASLRFTDIDSDGDLELLIPVSNKGQVIAFEASTGKELWSYQPDPVECTDSPPTIRDCDGDGRPELVYGTFLGNLHIVDALTGQAKRVHKISDEFIQTAPTAVELTGDEFMDFVCATFKGSNNVYAIDGQTGARIWTRLLPGEHMGIYHACAVGDLDGDKTIELVFAAYDGKVHCLNAADGSLKWSSQPGDAYFMSPATIADLDSDGDLEVIAAGENVSVIDHTGKIMWTKPCAAENSYDCVTRGASLADLDDDGRLDIATLSGAGEFTVFNATGSMLYQFSAKSICDFAPSQSSHGVTIADLDGNGKLDVFFVVGSAQSDQRAGLAVCLSGFKGRGRGWYMLGHDPESTGNGSTTIPASLLKHIER